MDESMEVPQPTQASPAKVFVQRKRAVKDPHAPTRPLSAYLCFLVNKQEEFRRSDPAKQVVAEITRRVGAAWRELSEDQRKVRVGCCFLSHPCIVDNLIVSSV